MCVAGYIVGERGREREEVGTGVNLTQKQVNKNKLFKIIVHQNNSYVK